MKGVLPLVVLGSVASSLFSLDSPWCVWAFVSIAWRLLKVYALEVCRFANHCFLCVITDVLFIFFFRFLFLSYPHLHFPLFIFIFLSALG